MLLFVFVAALVSPRLALFFIWLFSDLLGDAFEGLLVPLLGFLLLPWTTLAYAGMWALGPATGVSGLEWLVLILALLGDVGAYASGARRRSVTTTVTETRRVE